MYRGGGWSKTEVARFLPPFLLGLSSSSEPRARRSYRRHSYVCMSMTATHSPPYPPSLPSSPSSSFIAFFRRRLFCRNLQSLCTGWKEKFSPFVKWGQQISLRPSPCKQKPLHPEINLNPASFSSQSVFVLPFPPRPLSLLSSLLPLRGCLSLLRPPKGESGSSSLSISPSSRLLVLPLSSLRTLPPPRL